MRQTWLVALLVVALPFTVALAQEASKTPSIAEQQPNTWVKRSPLPGGPPSPRLGYESSWGYDPVARKMIRWGGHDPGGGGPQLSETWIYDPLTSKWEFPNTNNNPPGSCCCRENVFDPLANKFVRFSYPAFGHGWMWDRSRYLREDSVWTFDLAKNEWRDMRPGKEPALNVGKPAFWDPNHQIIWVYDTSLRAYDPYTNQWFSVNPSKDIKKRTYAGMALDPERNKIVLYGDHYNSDTRTWVYDIAKDTWTDMRPENGPDSPAATPTMVYDSNNRIMVCVMQSKPVAGAKEEEGTISRKMETWTYDLGLNKWTKMNPPGEPDNGGNRDKLLAFIPAMNIFVFEGRTKNEQQIWTYRYKVPPLPAPLLPAPSAPTGLTATTEEGGKVTLTWEKTVRETIPLVYQIYRAEGNDQAWKTEFKPVSGQLMTGTAYTDSGLKDGQIYYYRVTTVGDRGEGPPSNVVRTQPRLIVESRVDVLAKDKVQYSWKPSADKDIVGYVVERAILRPISGLQKISTAGQYDKSVNPTFMVEKAALGPFERLTSKPITETSFTDSVDLTRPAELKSIYWHPYFAGPAKGVPGTKPEDDAKNYDMTKPGCPFTIYAYRVRAVNKLGVEGGPSPYQMTVANEAENLCSKEDGNSVHLKWSASPHKDAKGYLVYRLNGRGAEWDKDSKIVLLTPQPIKELTFTDATAGKKTHRYYVIAVDAIGQEGLASHEAWSNRDYKGQIYDKWLAADGWHQ